jgi:hypothetical protein
MRHSFVAAVILFLACGAQAQEPTVNAVESLSSNEYLKLSAGLQALYVGGIIDGVSFTSYGYSLPKHDNYVRCVRTLTLGALAQEVVAWLRSNPSYRESMAGAVAQTLGAYCKATRSK